MRVAFVQTYPVYHDLLTQERWLALENRDRWMPGVLAAMGHDVELWAGAHEAEETTSRLDGFGELFRMLSFREIGAAARMVHLAAAALEELAVEKGFGRGTSFRAGLHLPVATRLAEVALIHNHSGLSRIPRHT